MKTQLTCYDWVDSLWMLLIGFVIGVFVTTMMRCDSLPACDDRAALVAGKE